MKAKWIAALLAGAVLGFATALLVRQPEAQAQGQGRRPVVWEFKVATFADFEQSGAQIAQLSADGWEYVGLINATYANSNAGPSMVAFRRPKR